MMTKRINPYARMDLIKPLIDYSNAVPDVGLEPILVHLVKIRASQINGCAVCLVMHTQEAHRDGETEMRIYLLSAWREALQFTPRERAALAWTEALTTLDHAAMNAAYELVAAEFSEAEQVVLTLLIGNINTWNRINAGFQVNPPRSATVKAAA
jgi:AhpD family alkylhydroperoxidase